MSALPPCSLPLTAQSLSRVAQQPNKLFADSQQQSELDLDFSTTFQKKVWLALLTIPFGLRQAKAATPWQP